ncbi:hypothetical protein GGI43DRAFT_393132, partial [Trichoderma evansii]
MIPAAFCAWTLFAKTASPLSVGPGRTLYLGTKWEDTGTDKALPWLEPKNRCRCLMTAGDIYRRGRRERLLIYTLSSSKPTSKLTPLDLTRADFYYYFFYLLLFFCF